MMSSSVYQLIVFFNLLYNSQSLQSGFTCDTSVTVECPSTRKIVILDVVYSSECPRLTAEENGTSIYAPSRCIAYYRERVSSQCNGQTSCMVDNTLEQRPSFTVGKQANCVFKGQSINVEYSCVPDFYSSKLPRVDLCSLQSLDELTEGFIHTPNYPQDYVDSANCSKVVPAPNAGQRLKIYAVDFELSNAQVARSNDGLEINRNGNRLKQIAQPFVSIFDDVIEASLSLKSSAKQGKSSQTRVLLYFIVTSMRRTRPPTTTTSEIPEVVFKEKPAALILEKRQKSNTSLALMVVLLCGILFVVLCGFLLYKRRNDRRVRYLTDTFQTFLPRRPKTESSETSDFPATKSIIAEEKDRLKVALNSSEFDHIYSEDPLDEKMRTNKALLFEYYDRRRLEPTDEVIYETIQPNQEPTSPHSQIQRP